MNRKGYSGAAFSGAPVAAWHPRNLTRSVIKGWWCADDHGTVRMTDDGSGLISAWLDRISGVSLTATTTARPTWTSTSFNSAYAGLTFNGTANCFVTTAYTALPTGTTAGEIWTASTQDSAGSPALVLVRSGIGSSTGRGIVSSGSKFTPQAMSTNILDLNSSPFTGPFIGGLAVTGTTLTARYNGSATNPDTATMGSTLNTDTTRLRVGASTGTTAAAFWIGVVRHLIFTTMLTAADRLRLEGWIAWDSGLTSLLPTTHPYRSVRP